MLRRLSDWMAVAAAICLVVLMLVTFIDVMGRYFFSAPLTYAVELTELGMGLLVCLGLALVTINRGHIAVDLVHRLMSPAIMRAMSRVAALLGFVFFSLAGWRLFDRAINFMGDGLATQVLFIPVYPVVFIMAIAAVVAAIIALVQCVKADGYRPPTGDIADQVRD